MYRQGDRVCIANVPQAPDVVKLMWEYHLMIEWMESKKILVVLGEMNGTYLVTDNEKQIHVPKGWIKPAHWN